MGGRLPRTTVPSVKLCSRAGLRAGDQRRPHDMHGYRCEWLVPGAAWNRVAGLLGKACLRSSSMLVHSPRHSGELKVLACLKQTVGIAGWDAYSRVGTQVWRIVERSGYASLACCAEGCVWRWWSAPGQPEQAHPHCHSESQPPRWLSRGSRRSRRCPAGGSAHVNIKPPVATAHRMCRKSEVCVLQVSIVHECYTFCFLYAKKAQCSC